MDHLIIKDAKCSCNIGVTKAERKRKQLVIVDIRVGLDTLVSAKTGKLRDTVDYVVICDKIRNIAEGREWVLLEILAEQLSQNIMKQHNAREVTVCVKKPKALQGKASYGGIEITRRRND